MKKKSNQMEDITKIGAMLYVGIDVGKFTHTAFFRTTGGATYGTFSFCSTRAGFDLFWKKLEAFRRS